MPAISIIIPLYNAKSYIAECLDSILAQTFKDFEVIIVDDCSTDDSFQIVESYLERFDGRLKIFSNKINSGAGFTRNKGLMLSHGEYIHYVDADDMLTNTALEESYTLAKEYNADVVYYTRNYRISEEGSIQTLRTAPIYRHIKGNVLDENLANRINDISKGRFWFTTWRIFTRRDFLIENELLFPNTKPDEDLIWALAVFTYAKRLLYMVNPIYIYRRSKNSILRSERSPVQSIAFWLNPVVGGLKTLNDLLIKHEFIKQNPQYLYTVLKFFIAKEFNSLFEFSKIIDSITFYLAIKQEYGSRFGEYDALISILCAYVNDLQKFYKKRAEEANASELRLAARVADLESELERLLTDEEFYSPPDCDAGIVRRFYRYFTARADIKLEQPKEQGDFQILSISDDRADVWKPDWFQKRGIGYQIQSYSGSIEIVAKANIDGQVILNLRGLDIRNPEDESKRIPYWIDYNKLIVNGIVVFDKLTPAWHDKPYNYKMMTKADEEILIEIEWLPHRSDN